MVELVLAQNPLRAAADEQFAIPADRFMPNHAHLLVEARTDSSKLRFISRSKQFSGFQYQQRHGQRLWQRYGYERVLRDDEDTRRVARYIVEIRFAVGWSPARRTTRS